MNLATDNLSKSGISKILWFRIGYRCFSFVIFICSYSFVLLSN